MQSILRATFLVPMIEPEWQSRLLLQLGSAASPEAPDRASQGAAAQAPSKPVFVDMGQGSREQQYRRQRPLLRIVTSGRPE
jgi:hypothetical protein